MKKSNLLAAAIIACGSVALAGCAGHATHQEASYVAHLQPLNAAVTGSATNGEARFTEDGDNLRIDIEVHGAPANTEHWQHFHGFPDGAQASCATAAADANGDGIVDLIETEPASGTTMVPFIQHPASMDVAHGTYPVADASGNYHYTDTVSLQALQAAFAKQFPGAQLDLDKRVVYIHGVPASTALPGSVASLGPIPASTTLPIACGVIQRVAR